MGKYMRKAKTTARDLPVMDLALGVRTRAKTLALRQQQHSPQLLTSSHATEPGSSGYLQLRNRRLQKPPISSQLSKRQKQNSNLSNCDKVLERSPSGPTDPSLKTESGQGMEEEKSESDGCNNQSGSKNESRNLGFESSLGENVLDFEGRDRSTRESTPCSLIREPEAIQTPGSATRPRSTAETNRRNYRSLPTEHEMEEFFAGPEQELQKKFTNRYNFDPVNDKPLPGRYEWEEMDPKRH